MHPDTLNTHKTGSMRVRRCFHQINLHTDFSIVPPVNTSPSIQEVVEKHLENLTGSKNYQPLLSIY